MPQADPLTEKVRSALLALEGTVIDDLRIPLPRDLRDIAKAAALVSGIVEDRIPTLLNNVRDRTWDEDGALTSYEFRRFTIGFPDILLVERADPTKVRFQLEAKSWYVLATDSLTARFLTSPTVMQGKTVIVVVAWVLDGVVSGSPKLVSIHSDDADRLAYVRDQAWIGIGDDHRVVLPENAPGTARSLLKTLVRGEKQRANGQWTKDSDNFGKLDRLYDDELQAFKASTFALPAAGKTLKQWHGFIKAAPSPVNEEDE